MHNQKLLLRMPAHRSIIVQSFEASKGQLDEDVFKMRLFEQFWASSAS